MGFFSWLMKGVNIEGQQTTTTTTALPDNEWHNENQLEDLQEIARKEKEYVYSTQSTKGINLIDDRLGLNSEKYAPRQSAPQSAELLVFKVGSNKDIQAAISHLSKQQPCIIDLGKVNKKERAKMMDYISGAVFALKGTMHPVKGENYILSPEGMKISLQEKIKTIKR